MGGIFSHQAGNPLIYYFHSCGGSGNAYDAIRFHPAFRFRTDLPTHGRHILVFYYMASNTTWFSALFQKMVGTDTARRNTAGNLAAALLETGPILEYNRYSFSCRSRLSSRYRALAVVALLTLAFALRIKPFARPGVYFLDARFSYMMLKVSYPLFTLLLIAPERGTPGSI